METLEWLDNLAARARQENPPPTNINIPLLLASIQSPPRTLRLVWPAMISSLAAAVLLTFALRASTPTAAPSSSSDPINSLFTPMQVQLP